MDDWISGSDNIDNALRLIEDVDDILKGANFNLRQWSLNNSLLLSNRNTYSNSKTFGVLWNTSADNFQYKTGVNNNKGFTKRSVLSIVAQIFDRLGIIGSVIVKAKLIMQTL